MREFSEDVQRFVRSHINSVEQLDALLLLRREPGTWSAEDVSARLFSSPPSAAMRLADLHARGLIQAENCDGTPVYCYQPRGLNEDRTIAALENLYRTRKDALIALIFSQPACP